MLGNPELIILDEPTVGLDPKQIIEIRDLIRTLGENHTVLLSSHILAEVSAICDQVMIISHGKLVASDTLENIRRSRIKENSVMITARATQDKITEILDKIDGIVKYTLTLSTPMSIAAAPGGTAAQDGGIWDAVIDVDEGADIRERLFLEFAAAGAPLRNLSSAELSLEEVFLQLTSESEVELDDDSVNLVLDAEKDQAESGDDAESSGDAETGGEADDGDDNGDDNGEDYYIPMFNAKDDGSGKGENKK